MATPLLEVLRGSQQSLPGSVAAHGSGTVLVWFEDGFGAHPCSVEA